MQFNNIYELDIKRLVRLLLPKRIRHINMLSWLYAMVAPAISIYQSLLRYRKAKAYQLLITPQVCYLERLLNDRFDFSLRRIRIDDAVWHTAWYLFQDDELKPDYIFQESENKPVYLYTDGEAGDVKDDFIVFVPQEITFDENELRSLLDSYRLAGKRYKVQKV